MLESEYFQCAKYGSEVLDLVKELGSDLLF